MTVKVVLGVRVEIEDFFEVQRDQIERHDLWDKEGPVPNFHPDTGKPLRYDGFYANPKPPFEKVSMFLDDYYKNLGDLADSWREWDDLFHDEPDQILRFLEDSIEIPKLHIYQDVQSRPGGIVNTILGRPILTEDLFQKWGGAECAEMPYYRVEEAQKTLKADLEKLGFGEKTLMMCMINFR